MGSICKSVLLTLLALCFFTSFVFTSKVTQAPSPSSSLPRHLPLPSAKPPIKLPTLPPAKAPIKVPTLPPAKAPIKVPTLPPAKAPIKPPVLPPVSPPKFNRTLVAVRGLVYCKSCKYAGVSTLLGAKPVKDAVVRLVCKKNKKNVISETKTDKNGYFLLLAPKTVSNYGIRACRAYLVKSPDAKCSKVSTLHGGDLGSVLKPVVKPGTSSVVINKLTYGLFNVGPFAFDPVCPK